MLTSLWYIKKQLQFSQDRLLKLLEMYKQFKGTATSCEIMWVIYFTERFQKDTQRDPYMADWWIKVKIEKTRTISQMLISSKFLFVQDAAKVTLEKKQLAWTLYIV